ncbi:hypothetical protein GCM10023192_66210 [Amycolatopsis samaneae]
MPSRRAETKPTSARKIPAISSTEVTTAHARRNAGCHRVHTGSTGSATQNRKSPHLFGVAPAITRAAPAF